MPIGEIIGEIILRPIIAGLSYLTGYIILKCVTFGAIRLAPLSTMHQKNPDKQKWHQIDWSIWLERLGRGRMLRAEVVCLVGMIAWGLAGLGIFLEYRGKDIEKVTSMRDYSSSSVY